MSDVKVLQALAFELESGQSPAAWGAGAATLGTNDKYSFTNFEKGVTVNSEESNDMLSDGFPSTPQQTGIYVEKSLSRNMDYLTFNKWLYWVFGFEHVVDSVCVFVLSTPSVEPTAGAVYQDVNTNSFTFIRKEVYKNDTYYVFTCTTAPTLQTGNLTKQSGTGDTTLIFSAHSSLMYEHWFEFDAHERHNAAYRTAEQITGWVPGYNKCRRATLGLKTTVTDLRYMNAMCKKWGFKSSAGKIVGCDFDFCAYRENRGDYSSSAWTPHTALLDNYMMLHHHLRFKVGVSEAALVNLGVTDINFGVDTPVEIVQDTESGLYLAEPKLEGKYSFSLDAKLTRYSAETYQSYRDSWTDLVACIEAQSGYYAFNLLFNKVKLPGSGPDSDNVTKEPLKFEVCHTTSSPFTIKGQGFTTIQNSPVIGFIRNSISSNSMLLN